MIAYLLASILYARLLFPACYFVDQCDASMCLLINANGEDTVTVPQSWLGTRGREGAFIEFHDEVTPCDEVDRVRACRSDDKSGKGHGARWCKDVDTREPVRLAWPTSGMVKL